MDDRKALKPIDFTPIFCAFYTKGTRYEQEAARLRRTLEKLELPYDIEAIEDRGDWAANASQTAAFCVRMLAKHFYRPVVYLDADAVVRKFPQMFYEFDGVDIAAHWVNGVTFANGTVYFGRGPISASIARRYLTLVESHGGTHPNEQKLLEQAIADHAPGAKVSRLPASYCYIADHNGRDCRPDEVVIAHLQASRERAGGGDALDRRRKWIQEYEAGTAA